MSRTLPNTLPVVSDTEIAAGVVCLMCGVAGSGKTTWAQQLEIRGLVRLSIDEEIWRRFGRYGVDYQPDRYGELQEAAQGHLDVELEGLLRAGTAAVLDLSFWQRTQRESYKELIERYARPCKLLVLRVEPAVLCRRLEARQQRFDANAALPIPEDLLHSYLAGFEWSQGEGEIMLPT